MKKSIDYRIFPYPYGDSYRMIPISVHINMTFVSDGSKCLALLRMLQLILFGMIYVHHTNANERLRYIVSCKRLEKVKTKVYFKNPTKLC